MTMLDDDTLAALFARAAEAFEVPAAGAEDIVARTLGPARTDELARGDEPGVLRRVAATARQHRILSVAACILLVLVLVGSVGALRRASVTPHSSPSSLAKIPVGHPAVPPTSTTIPRGSANRGAESVGSAAGAAPSPGFSTSRQTQSPNAQGATNTAPSLPSNAVGQSAKIEQTGSLGLTVGRGALAKTMTELTNLAATFGGFVASSQTQTGAGTGGPPYGTITLQVPVQNFSAALTQAQALGKTTSLSTKATDVTGQYVDLQSRLAALQASRQQYLTIMTKASSVGDVLAVQAQLDTIQTQIEQLQGQLNVLTSETSYSSLTVTASEGIPPTHPRPVPLPESGLVRAWHDSVGGFVGDLEGLIRAAGPALFALLCVAALALGGRALWRRFQRHNL